MYHVKIKLSLEVDTLNFGITKPERDALYECGKSYTHSFFRAELPQWRQAKNIIEELQAVHGPPKLINQILEVIAKDIDNCSNAENIRSSIMLPTVHNTRIVTYHYNMDNDPDIDLELPMEAGCAGMAWNKRSPAFADLIKAQEMPEAWFMTRNQQNKIPKDRRSAVSSPIFNLSDALTASKTSIDSLTLVGTLSIDSTTELEKTGWVDAKLCKCCGDLLSRIRFWSDVLGKVLS